MRFKANNKEKWYKSAAYTVSLLLSFGYILYRVIYTVPVDLGFINAFFGILIVVFEIVELFNFFIFYSNTLCVGKQSPEIPKVEENKFPKVDVLIATINEDEDIIEGTIAACLAMDYPDFKVYVCDDGKRDKIKKLAKKYKVGYITRKGHKYAKAGNYNNALEQTKAPLVAIFDTDMKPEPQFLKKTVPFFVKYEKVGFVQTPQSFNNPDIFQNRLSIKTPFEQDYFYHRIQMARNNVNSTILCGTNCVIAREALDSICGFATNTIAEDIATGMLIESKGYSGIAIDEVLVHGDAIDNLSGFLKQRSRWGRGCIQVFKNYGFFWRKGLSLRQKLDYYVAIDYWTFGIKNLVYLVFPLLFALFGIIAIKGDLLIFITIFMAQYLVRRFLIDALEGYYRSSTWSKIYELILMPILAKNVLREIFGFGDLKFEVTPKGGAKKRENEAKKSLIGFHSFFLGLSVLGIFLSIYKMSMVDVVTYIIPVIWLSINVFYLTIALVFDLRKYREFTDFKPDLIKKYTTKSYWGLLRRR